MKKILILLAVVVLVFAGCTTKANNDKKMAEDTSEQHVEEETMAEDKMDQKDDMENKDSADEEKDMDSEDEAMEDNFLNVTMMDIDGNEWNLAKLNKKAVVKVWASWCSICLSGLDEYEEFTSTYEDAQVLTVVTPGMFGEMNKEEFIEWFKGLDGVENMVVIIDEEGVLINNIGIRGFPTYVYLNSSGMVDSTAIGHQSTADVIARLEGIG